VLTYLINERPWAPPSVRASEPALLSVMPVGVACAHASSVPVASAPVASVVVVGVSGVSVAEGALTVERLLADQPVERQLVSQFGMWPSRTLNQGTTGFTTAAKDNLKASKHVNGASGVPPRGRPV